MLILALLVLEFAICLMITVWPQCLGLNLDETLLVKALQGQYGISGQEQFTTAMDLAQTQFECCAINSAINYDTSLWKLQALGQKDLTVPLTCCKLANRAEAKAYLDPKPANLTQCQALQPHEYEKSRHLDGCLTKIDLWYREQYVLFLIAGLVVAIVEFGVLLSIIYSCTKLSTTAAVHKIRQPPATMPAKSLATRSHSSQQILHVDSGSREASSSPASTALMDVRETYIQPKSLQKPKYAVPFKPSYQVSKSYLV
jgi:Tetraspanin family